MVSLSFPPLGRAVFKTKHKTTKSSELENQSKISEDSLVVGGGSHDEKEEEKNGVIMEQTFEKITVEQVMEVREF